MLTCADAPKPYNPNRPPGWMLAQPQRTVADHAGAQQRRSLRVVEAGRQVVRVLSRGDDILRKATIRVEAVKADFGAQVFLAGQAEPAVSARAAQPRQPGPVTGTKTRHARAHLIHHADDLVARHQRQPRQRQVALDDVQVGVADAAGMDAQTHLASARLRRRQLLQRQMASCTDRPGRLSIPLPAC